MRLSTTDPMTLDDVTGTEQAPCVVEKQVEDARKIYFESEQTHVDDPGLDSHGSDAISGLKEIFDASTDDPDTGKTNETANLTPKQFSNGERAKANRVPG